MYTTEEYKRRIKELGPVARDIAAEKTPDEAREMISKVNYPRLKPGACRDGNI